MSLLGGLIGSKKKNEEVVNRVDYARMVKDAEAAGINPLTALRNGGAAGFSITSQPVLSSKHAAIGEALGGLGNFIANFDPFEDKMREVQYRTMQAQLENLQADTGLKRKAMFTPPAVTGRRQVTAGPSLGPTAGRSQTPTVEVPTVTNPWPTGWADVNPGYVDAEAWETRYGDIAQELGGAINMHEDVYGMFKRMMDGYFFPKGKAKPKSSPSKPAYSSWWK